MGSKLETKLSIDIQNSLRQTYKTDIFLWKNHGNMFSLEGLPDITGVYKGYMFALEVKIPNGRYKLTDEQKARIRQIRAAGGYAYKCVSVEQAHKVIKKIKKEKDL